MPTAENVPCHGDAADVVQAPVNEPMLPVMVGAIPGATVPVLATPGKGSVAGTPVPGPSVVAERVDSVERASKVKRVVFLMTTHARGTQGRGQKKKTIDSEAMKARVLLPYSEHSCGRMTYIG